MSIQLPLPAGWAGNFQSNGDPVEQLFALRQDVLDAKAEIRAALNAWRRSITYRCAKSTVRWAGPTMVSAIWSTQSSASWNMRSKTGIPLDRAALAVAAEVQVRSSGRQMHWVMVGDLVPALGLDEDVLDTAVQRAIAKGLLIGEGNPAHSICLASGTGGKLAKL